MNGNLSTKKLSLESLSTYRNVLMGLEILLIIIFHFTEDCRLYDVRYGGWVEWFDIYIHSSGVDMFLLLSGMGLYFSMKKGTGQKAFYRKRFEKILIPYVIVAVPAWFWLDLIQEKNGILAFLADVSFVSFFFQEKRWFWYILTSNRFGAVAVLRALYDVPNLLHDFIRRQLADIPDCEFIRASRFTSCVRLDVSVCQQYVLSFQHERHQVDKLTTFFALCI